MGDSLATTNVMLAVMAAVSALEGILILGACIACFIVYRRAMALYLQTMDLISGIESRQVAPAMARVNAILDDVRSVSATVKGETDRVDHAIHHTIDRVDDTVDRVRSTVRHKTSRLVGLVKGARVALETVLESRT
jgi:hypothetical protein